jgi:hypothetical protein
VTLSFLEDNAADIYYRFNVPQGMQNIVLDEWDKADDIGTYTRKYLALNQTEHDLLGCIKRLCLKAQDQPEIGELREAVGIEEQDRAQILRITQGGSDFRGSNVVTGGSQFHGNFVGLGHSLFHSGSSK